MRKGENEKRVVKRKEWNMVKEIGENWIEVLKIERKVVKDKGRSKWKRKRKEKKINEFEEIVGSNLSEEVWGI